MMRIFSKIDLQVAGAVDEDLLPRAEADRRARMEQPDPHREGAAHPRRAAVARLLDRRRGLGREALVQPVDELALPLEQHARAASPARRRWRACGSYRYTQSRDEVGRMLARTEAARRPAGLDPP